MMKQIFKILKKWKLDPDNFKKFADLKNVFFPTFKTMQGKLICSPQ